MGSPHSICARCVSHVSASVARQREIFLYFLNISDELEEGEYGRGLRKDRRRKGEEGGDRKGEGRRRGRNE